MREIADLLVRFDADIERIAHYSASRRDYYNWKREAVEYQKRRLLVLSKIASKPVDAPLDQVGQLRAAQ